MNIRFFRITTIALAWSILAPLTAIAAGHAPGRTQPIAFPNPKALVE